MTASAQGRQLSAEELHMNFGYSFQNPHPKASGSPRLIGGVGFPFGSVSVEIQGRHFVVPAAGVLTVRRGPVGANAELHELARLVAQGDEIVMLHPEPEIVRDAILGHIGSNAGSKDAGIRMWDLSRIAGMTEREQTLYINGLTREGRERLTELIADTVLHDRTSEENLARQQNRQPNPPLPYQVRMIGVYEGLMLAMDKEGGDTSAKDAAALKKAAVQTMPDFSAIADMTFNDLRRAGKEMGLDIPLGIKKKSLLALISEAVTSKAAENSEVEAEVDDDIPDLPEDEEGDEE